MIYLKCGSLELFYPCNPKNLYVAVLNVERMGDKMIITVCIGSSCHMKGSRIVVEKLQKLINEKKLSDAIEIRGTFCMGNCQKGVCVDIDGEVFSVSPDNVDNFFEKEVSQRL